ncbi:MAG TPA: hypothetical protein VJ998_11405, partial [Pseudomonadales bacterium]|nr:hypothetical protein [Pseudomonadales bacterium]
MSSYLPALVTLILLFLLGPRPRLIALRPEVKVPHGGSLKDLSSWLDEKEAATPALIAGAEAKIQFATPAAPAKTRLVFVYIHG